MRWRTTIATFVAVGGLLAGGCGTTGGDESADIVTSERGAAAEKGDGEAGDLVGRASDVRVSVRPLGRLDPRCRKGRVLCADKSTRTLRWVVDGEITMTFDARFGVGRYATREGRFEVYDMLRRHESSLYGTQMPFAMFFSGGQAVHYSRDFAKKGYAGISHGCINLRDWDGIAKLFRQVREGDTVIVYHSRKLDAT